MINNYFFILLIIQLNLGCGDEDGDNGLYHNNFPMFNRKFYNVLNVGFKMT
jgi:hypothetical protein